VSSVAGEESPIRFSVVIPALDEMDYLGATLSSLTAQDFTGQVEIIVVDNGSSDRTAELAARRGARVLHEPRRGVCVARQRGTAAARGEIVVSTDADTTHPTDWLTRLDRRFRDTPGAVAVAGPCRYAAPLWWAAVFPPLWFAGLALVNRLCGWVGYLSATNVAFVREGFPGYDITLTQGGDEVDLLRRLRRHGHVVWAPDVVVSTSSRRMNQGLAYTILVSYGYHYAFTYLLNRVSGGALGAPAPAIRQTDDRRVRRRRRSWLIGSSTAIAALIALRIEVRKSRRFKAQ
jgi:glycosyltransferase involved in cell wall biosynthesis